VAEPTFRPPAELFPFESRWFDWHGSRVHYVDDGRGRSLVLLHGNATFSFVYRAIIAELRDCFRCIALDYPGFGLSDHPLWRTPCAWAPCGPCPNGSETSLPVSERTRPADRGARGGRA
jgi:pimeloyl-ACP methyl ester carboxylesterase